MEARFGAFLPDAALFDMQVGETRMERDITSAATGVRIAGLCLHVEPHGISWKQPTCSCNMKARYFERMDIQAAKERACGNLQPANSIAADL